MRKLKKAVQWAWRKIKAFWPWYKNLYKGRAWYTKTLIAFVSFLAFIFIYLGAVDINFLGCLARALAISQASSTLHPTRRQKSTVPMAS